MSGGVNAHLNSGEVIYTLHPANNGELECFDTVEQAKKRAGEG